MRENRPRALIISYYYPPINTAGAQRALSFAKYLPDYGYDVRVLTTARHGSVLGEDASLVCRAIEPYGYLIAPFRNLLMRSVPTERRPAARVLSSESRLARLQNCLLIPDQAITWFPFATWLGGQMGHRLPFDVILSTSPPESAHLAAMTLKKQFEVPWVADFRDGWLFEPLKPPECYRGWRGRLMACLESQVVLGADRVIAVTSPIAQDFRDRYPDVAQKVHVLTNGYDEAEIREVKRSRGADGVFQIVYTGALALSRPDRSAMPFFLALAEIVQENKDEISNHLRVLFVGDFLAQEKAEVSRIGLDRWVEFRDWVPRLQALQFQTDADVLLLITAPHRRGVTTAKLFDYIGVRQPVLALAKGDAAGQIVEQCQIGWVVDRQDVGEIRSAITDMYCRWRTGDLTLGGDPPREYGRRFQARALARMFDAMLNRAPAEFMSKG